MKKQISKMAIVTLLCLWCPLVVASSIDDSIDRLMSLSGLDKQMEAFPETVKMGLQQGVQQGAAVAEDTLAAMLASADRTILPAVILAEVRSSIKQNINAGEINTLLKWYESDLGSKITAAEEQGSTAKAYQQMVSSSQQLLANAERVETARRFDQLLGATDMALDLQSYGGEAVYTAIMTAMAPGKDVDLQPYRSYMASMKPQLEANVKQSVVLSYVYCYRSISDSELQQYQDFLTQPVSQKYHDSVTKGLMVGIKQVVSDWAVDISGLFKDSKQSAR